MTVFWAVRHGMTLSPADPEGVDAISKLAQGVAFRVEAKETRNGAHHRLYWVLCARIGKAVGVDSETVSDLLKIATGHCVTIKSATHGTLRLPKSISFASMDQSEFRAFFEKCIETVTTEWGIARPDVLRECRDIIDGNLPWQRAA